MKNHIIITTLVMVIYCCAPVMPGICHAEDNFSSFSLDCASLTSAPADPKAPEPGGVTAKYGFSFAKDFKTYLGTGLAYSVKPVTKPGDTKIIRTGVAGQAGIYYLLGNNSSLNIDYKLFNVAPDAMRSDCRTLPQSLGVGLEIKF